MLFGFCRNGALLQDVRYFWTTVESRIVDFMVDEMNYHLLRPFVWDAYYVSQSRGDRSFAMMSSITRRSLLLDYLDGKLQNLKCSIFDICTDTSIFEIFLKISSNVSAFF